MPAFATGSLVKRMAALEIRSRREKDTDRIRADKERIIMANILVNKFSFLPKLFFTTRKEIPGRSV